jgi:NAD(P)-dependent dehydrogenase (short-subunit alcohol dehydrogenase family)
MKSAGARQISRFLTGKHALVTGGSRGIGAAIVRILLNHGARVTMLARNEKTLEDAAQELAKAGEVYHVTANVSDADEVRRAFQEARRRFDRIDILVNNAGNASSAPFVKTDAELWRRMLAVNLDGTFYCTQAALPEMLAAGWGRVVNVASTAGLTGYAYVSAYCAAKHAVVGLTRALAVEVATKGVTVNAVCPGYTDTDVIRESVDNIVAKTGRSAEDVRSELIFRNPQKRLVQPEEAANAVAWLCLPGSEAINGQAIAVAGGEVM